jgi:hypothetical protein
MLLIESIDKLITELAPPQRRINTEEDERVTTPKYLQTHMSKLGAYGVMPLGGAIMGAKIGGTAALAAGAADHELIPALGVGAAIGTGLGALAGHVSSKFACPPGYKLHWLRRTCEKV